MGCTLILQAIDQLSGVYQHAVDLLPRTGGPGASPAPAPPAYNPPPVKNVPMPEKMAEGVGRIFGFITTIVFALALAGVLFCAVRVALAYKNGGEVLAPGLIAPLIACIIAVSASGIISIVVL